MGSGVGICASKGETAKLHKKKQRCLNMLSVKYLGFAARTQANNGFVLSDTPSADSGRQLFQASAATFG
jgi:hypothetical protein